MTSLPAPAPAAIAAFLRGVARRAALLVQVQAGGHHASAEQALQVASQVFASEVGPRPIAEWPRQFWTLLLAAPALRRGADAAPGARLPGVARLPPDQRAAVLLHLVAGLDEADAAAVLGIGVQDYQQRIRDALPRDVLGQPDLDVWRAWRAQAERELAAMPEPPLPDVQRARNAPGAPPPVPVPESELPEQDDDGRHRRRMRWLWLGLLLSTIAMAATFLLHPRGRDLMDQWRMQVRVEALDAAAAPRARFDPADIARHPDHELLSAPNELALARELPLLSWLAVAASDAQFGPSLPPPIRDATNAGALPPTGDGAAALADRQRAWDALAPATRARQRGAWAAWRALQPADRVLLRALGQRWQLASPVQRHQLRTRFDALAHDVRHGGWLGPRFVRDWPRVAPLFGFVPEAQRTQLLQLLLAAEPEDVDALERLAQSTPPEDREALRVALLQVPGGQRRAWMLERLQN